MGPVPKQSSQLDQDRKKIVLPQKLTKRGVLEEVRGVFLIRKNLHVIEEVGLLLLRKDRPGEIGGVGGFKQNAKKGLERAGERVLKTCAREPFKRAFQVALQKVLYGTIHLHQLV